MTLDITIGELTKTSDSEFGFDNVMDNLKGMDVNPCPESTVPICDIEFTIHPYEARRSGAYGSFPGFIQKYLPKMYKELGVSGIAKLSRYYAAIMKLPEREGGLDGDRIRWFKYWAAMAKRLYGPRAGISFS
jgi:hypothetical protein